MNNVEDQVELDPYEMIILSRKYFDERVRGAYDEGAEIKQRELESFLFCLFEFYSYSFRPKNLTRKKFLKATLYKMMAEFKVSYVRPRKRKVKTKVK